MTMRERQRRKLAAKGWVAGNAEDFPGLSKQESVYIELRLKLAEGLKCKCQSKGVTRTQLARTLSSSTSRVAKMESADPTVSLDLLVKSLLALGTSRRQLASIIAQR